MKTLTLIIISVILLQSVQYATAQSWNLTGNSGTSPATQFIGTTDNKALKIRTNNNVRLTISSTGKVGIGTASPVFKLDVRGGSINTDSVYRLGGITVLSIKGDGNAFAGADAGSSNTSGYFNAALGTGALLSNTTGSYNTTNGAYALEFNTTGEGNTADGAFALNANTTGSYNSANGSQALQFNTTGHENTANGYLSLYGNTTGSYNVAIGNLACLNNTTASMNVAIGYSALQTQSFSNSGVTWNSENVAIGYQALFSNQPVNNFTAHRNTAVGTQALVDNTLGSGNVASGYGALSTNTAGSDNTASGDLALSGNTTGIANTAIGSVADGNAGNYVNSSAFGNASLFTASNQVRIGNGTVTSIGGFVNFTNISDGRFKKNIKEDVSGLDFINKLKPVTYTLDIHGINHYLRNGMQETKSYEGEESTIVAKEQIVYSGFIAQDVEKAAQEVGYDFSGVDAPKNERDVYGLRYAEFVVPLVKAVQELDEENGKLKIENDELRDQVTKLNAAVFGDGLNNMNSKINKLPISSGQAPSEIILGQNIPNPFDNATIIPFHIPTDCRDAAIMIINASTAEVITVIPVSCNEDHISFDSEKLATGTYSYFLMVNGLVADTKQMVHIKQ